jgi:hypothetical protein
MDRAPERAPPGASESDDEEEHGLRGGKRDGEVDDALELSAPAVGPERWDVLGLGQAMVRQPLSSPPLPLRASCKIVFPHIGSTAESVIARVDSLDAVVLQLAARPHGRTQRN